MIYDYSICAVSLSVFIYVIADILLKNRKKYSSGWKMFLGRGVSAFGALILLASGMIYYEKTTAVSVTDILSALLVLYIGSSPYRDYKMCRIVLASVLFLLSANVFIRLLCRMVHYDIPGVYFERIYPAAISIITCVHVSVTSRIAGKENCDTGRSFLMTGGLAASLITLLFITGYADTVPENIRRIFIATCTAASLSLYLAAYSRLYPKAVSGTYTGSASISAMLDVREAVGKNEDTASRELFSRIIVLFDNEKPYLDSDLTINEVARRLFSNKAYVSKAVNMYTGKNFCQFVNFYRVMYSVGLFDENPYLRVSELAEMSGFHTMASYNSSFHVVMGDSPGEWCRKYRLKKERQ